MARIEHAVPRRDNLGARIERGKAPEQTFHGRGIGQISLRQYEAVRQDHLCARFGERIERPRARDGIDNSQHGLDVKLFPQGAVGREGAQDRSGIG